MHNRLEEIKARCEAATSGVWIASTRDQRGLVWATERDDNTMEIVCSVPYGVYQQEENQSFICHAHEDIPYLLAHIKKLEAENRWISVDERLPENNTIVLVFDELHITDDDKPGQGIFTAEYGDYDGLASESSFHGIGGLGTFSTITHWKPLPQPPTGKGD